MVSEILNCLVQLFIKNNQIKTYINLIKSAYIQNTLNLNLHIAFVIET